MYEEERPRGSFLRGLVINLLYMVLFLFLFMWIYPAPRVDLGDINVDREAMSPLLSQIFNQNLERMRISAREYYTIDRRPTRVGETRRMTLGEMLEKRIIAPFVDEHGNACDPVRSYVLVTKLNDNRTSEYSLRVNLHCDTRQGYIIDTIGCTQTCIGCITDTERVVSDAVREICTNCRPGGQTPQTPQQPQPPQPPRQPDPPRKPEPPRPPQQPQPQFLYERERWVPDGGWTRTRRNGPDLRESDRRTVWETEQRNESFTYRTVSWVTLRHANHNYSLFLNNIPTDARNVRVTSHSRFGQGTEMQLYRNNRFTCVIQMTNWGCPQPTDAAIIQNNNLASTRVLNFGYNLSTVYRLNNRWAIDINIQNWQHNPDASWEELLVPIRFTVVWTEEEEVRVTEFRYERREVETRTSNSANDTNLINQGFRLVRQIN